MTNDVLESGAENMETAGDNYEITTAVPDFETVKKALAKKYKFVSSELGHLPKDPVKVGIIYSRTGALSPSGRVSAEIVVMAAAYPYGCAGG